MNSKLTNHLDDQARIFKKLGRKTFKRPSPKRIHKLRINIRKIRAVLWLGEHGSSDLSFNKLSSSLRRLSRALGEVRQLEVAENDSRKYNLKISNLDNRVQATEKHLHNEINRSRRIKILRQIRRANQKLKKHSELNLSAATSKLEDHVHSWIKREEFQNNELHRLRIDTKKARYALEAIGKTVKPLRDLQSHLGRVHDLMVLQELTKKNKELESLLNLECEATKPIIKPTLQFALKQFNVNKSRH